MMKLSQSRVVPLAMFTAITAAVMAILLFQGQLVFGQEDPVVCIPNSAASIIVTDATVGCVQIVDVTEVSHGMRVAFQTILSVGELPAGQVACTFEGGDLTITTPDGETQELAGGSTGYRDSAWSRSGTVYSEAQGREYTVDQAHADQRSIGRQRLVQQRRPLTALPETEARATGENKFALEAPSIEVAVDARRADNIRGWRRRISGSPLPTPEASQLSNVRGFRFAWTPLVPTSP